MPAIFCVWAQLGLRWNKIKEKVYSLSDVGLIILSSSLYLEAQQAKGDCKGFIIRYYLRPFSPSAAVPSLTSVSAYL